MNLRAILRAIVSWAVWGWTTAAMGAAPATRPSTQGVGAPGRIEFKTIELASVETSLDAVYHALLNAGYKSAVASSAAADAIKGNINMDRNGGAPVSWRDFYGRSVRDFSSRDIFGDRQPYRRPPQFDYIYRANNEKRAMLQHEVESLGKQTDALLARRRQLESDQVGLWATLAWETVGDCDIELQPIYRFKIQEAKPASAEGTARRKSAGGAVTFLAAINTSFQGGLDHVSADPVQTISDVGNQTKDAFANFRSAASDAMLDLNGDDKKSAKDLLETAKHLYDLTRNAADAQKLALERAAAKDENGRVTFRGQLQSALLDSCAATYQLDSQIHALVTAWGLTVDREAPLAREGGPTTTTQPSAASTIEPVAAGNGQAIDLIKLVDLNKDSVEGMWSRKGDSMTFARDSRIEFPYVPPAEYDLAVRFTRTKGKWAMSIICVQNGHQLCWTMGAGENKVCGFQTVDGKGAADRANPTYKEKKSGWMANGQPCTAIVKVRRDHVEGWMDGELVDSFATDGSNMSLPVGTKLHSKDTVGFTTFDAGSVESAVLMPVSGEGKPLR